VAEGHGHPLVDVNANNGARTALISTIIQMHKTPNSHSKCPLTKLKEIISYCSISFYTNTFIDVYQLGHKKVVNILEFD